MEEKIKQLLSSPQEENKLLGFEFIKNGLVKMEEVFPSWKLDFEFLLKYNKVADKGSDFLNFVGLVNLEVLSLNNNNLTTVPPFDSLVNLKHLSLYNNRLTTVPNFDSLVNLEVLSLNSNSLTTVPNFDSLVNLEVLSLNNNNLTTVYTHAKANVWQ